jgi:hypothetical protein
MKPVVMYCEENSTFLGWLVAHTLEPLYQCHVKVARPGDFVKSIGYENFD